MSDLVRKQVYITREQEDLLKKKSARLGISEAEIIRESLNRQMHKICFPRRSAERWQEEMRFIRERMAGGKLKFESALQRDEADE